jgi:hypothetical protein
MRVETWTFLSSVVVSCPDTAVHVKTAAPAEIGRNARNAPFSYTRTDVSLIQRWLPGVTDPKINVESLAATL